MMRRSTDTTNGKWLELLSAAVSATRHDLGQERSLVFEEDWGVWGFRFDNFSLYIFKLVIQTLALTIWLSHLAFLQSVLQST